MAPLYLQSDLRHRQNSSGGPGQFPRFVGVDLAWGERARTGLAVLDDAGTLLALAKARTDEEILAWLAPWTSGDCVVAIDAPLVVRNESGSRGCEKSLNAVFARYDAGAHPSNTSRPAFHDGGRARRIAVELDLDVDPDSRSPRRAIEVYPHPATVALFRLDRTIKYKHKPGRSLEQLKAEAQRLVQQLTALEAADPPLRLGAHEGWRQIHRAVATAARKRDLRAVEDRIDAVLCAYVGLFATRRPDDTTVFGDVETGYIVTPTLPEYAPPPRRRRVAVPPADAVSDEDLQGPSARRDDPNQVP